MALWYALRANGSGPQKPTLLVEIIGKHRPGGGGAGVALAEFNPKQEALAAIGAGVLAQEFRRRVAQGEAAVAGEQGAKRRVGAEIDLLGDFPDIEDRRRAVEQNRRLVIIGEKRIGDGPEIDAAMGLEGAEIAVEADLPREGDRRRRGVLARHRPQKTGAAAMRTGIGGEVGVPDGLRPPAVAPWRVRRWRGR